MSTNESSVEYRTRRIVKPGDLNSANNLFGGRLLEWIDEECGIFALLLPGISRVVTKLISQIDFRAPARQGHIVDIGIAIVGVGRTSVTLRAEAFNRSRGVTMLTIDRIVMVAVDEQGLPTPHGIVHRPADEAPRG